MSLYEQWKELASRQRTKDEYNKFWEGYFEKEKKNYEHILEHHEEVLEGTLANLAETFGMDNVVMTGFLDGINTSLVEPLDIEALNEDSELKLKLDFEKLYFNMHDAKADWLYNLPQWAGVLSEERRAEITKEYRKSKIAVSTKVGRNDPCPCNSGKKYKKCCGANV